MVVLPEPQQIAGFVVFFFPGFVSLLVAVNLLGFSVKNRSVIETVVVSYVLSVVLFYILSPILGVEITATSIGQIVLSPNNSILIFGSSLMLGVLIAAFIGVWLYISEIILIFSDWLIRKLGFQRITFSPVSTVFLREVWKNREVNDIMIITTSGEMFRGKLGSYSIEPKFEILLIRRNDVPIRKFDGNKWIALDEWGIWLSDKHIYSIRAIARG